MAEETLPDRSTSTPLDPYQSILRWGSDEHQAILSKVRRRVLKARCLTLWPLFRNDLSHEVCSGKQDLPLVQIPCGAQLFPYYTAARSIRKAPNKRYHRKLLEMCPSIPQYYPAREGDQAVDHLLDIAKLFAN